MVAVQGAQVLLCGHQEDLENVRAVLLHEPNSKTYQTLCFTKDSAQKEWSVNYFVLFYLQNAKKKPSDLSQDASQGRFGSTSSMAFKGSPRMDAAAMAAWFSLSWRMETYATGTVAKPRRGSQDFVVPKHLFSIKQCFSARSCFQKCPAKPSFPNSPSCSQISWASANSTKYFNASTHVAQCM